MRMRFRFLSMDAVEKANSGHPGMPMGMADIAAVLWRDFLFVNPDNPNWVIAIVLFYLMVTGACCIMRYFI